MVVLGHQTGMVVEQRPDRLGVVRPVGGQPPARPVLEPGGDQVGERGLDQPALVVPGLGPRVGEERPQLVDRALGQQVGEPGAPRRPATIRTLSNLLGDQGPEQSARSPAGRPRRPGCCSPAGPGPSAPATHRCRARSRRSAGPGGRTSRSRSSALSGCTEVEVSSRGTSSTKPVPVLLPGPPLRRPHPVAAPDERDDLTPYPPTGVGPVWGKFAHDPAESSG